MVHRPPGKKLPVRLCIDVIFPGVFIGRETVVFLGRIKTLPQPTNASRSSAGEYKRHLLIQNNEFIYMENEKSVLTLITTTGISLSCFPWR